MEYLITIFLSVLDFVVLYNICQSFLIIDKPATFIIKYISCFSLNLCYLLYITFGNTLPLPKLVISSLLVFVTAYFSFAGSIFIKCICTLFHLILLYGTDYFFSLILMALGWSFTDIVNNYALFMIVSSTSRFLAILISFIFKRKVTAIRRQYDTGYFQWVQFFMYSLCSLLTLYLLMNSALASNTSSFILIFDTIAIILCNVIIFFIMDKLQELNDTTKQNSLLNQQIKIEIENAETLSQAYTKQRTLSHEFNNHLSIIDSLLNEGNLLAAHDYTNNLLKNTIKENSIFNSNNSVIDALLTKKYLIAQKHEITMITYLDDLSDIPISNEDIVVILSNMLDNAIEACKECNDKIIKLKFEHEYDNYILSVNNTAKDKFILDNGEYVTTKKDKINHGFGIKNIKSILDKYGFFNNIVYEDGWFRFTILMQG